MKLGRVSLTYQGPSGRLEGLLGHLPVTNGRLRLEGFGGSSEVGLRVAEAEPGLRLLHLTVELEDVDLRDRFLANGFQSWSETRLLGPDDRMRGLRLLGFLKPYGDYGWADYPGRPGCLHSHWLTYTADLDAAPGSDGGDRAGHGNLSFVGSLNEATAYTVFRVDYKAGRLWAAIDVEGLEPQPGTTLAHIWSAEGPSLPPLVRAYADRLAEVEAGGPLVRVPDHRPGGWNSWYNYYGKVTRQDIMDETAALRAAGLDLDFVQIDDGWQAEIGDWLEVSPRFAGGEGGAGAPGSTMKNLASAIRDAGFEPGIWVAPLVATKQSEVFRRRWIKPWKAGWNPGWGSSIYALDLGRPEVADHVRRVGDAFREWGYGLVKADFLYAAAVHPWGGRTRAQRMREAMRLVREAMPGRLLGCGVPLASAAGLVDYCRLGADTMSRWEDPLLAFCRYRERPSCRGALRTVLNRWFMNGPLFVLDPDVFLFGPGRLGPAEQRAIYEVLTAVGGMQSFSDSVAKLPPEAMRTLAATFPLPEAEVLSVGEPERDLFRVRVRFGRQGRREETEFLANLADRPQAGIQPHSTETR